MTALIGALEANDGLMSVTPPLANVSLPVPVTIESENLLITGGDGTAANPYSITRGQNGTLGAAHTAGTTVTTGWSGGGGSISATGTSGSATGTAVQLPGVVSQVDGSTIGVAAPTLAEVLVAGNATGETIVVMPEGTLNGTTANGEIDLTGNDGGVGADGKDVIVAGGRGDAGFTGNSFILLGGGKGDGTGSIFLLNTGQAKAGSGKQGGDVTWQLGAGDGAGRNGLFILPALPTVDPAVSGALWKDAVTNIVKQSP